LFVLGKARQDKPKFDIIKFGAIFEHIFNFTDVKITSINLYHPLQIYKSYLRVLPMEGLTIRKAIAKDRDSIFEIFESQDTKWDIPYTRQYAVKFFKIRLAHHH
jgi:hypothetical protein